MKKRVVFGLSCWLAGALVIGSAGGLWGIRDILLFLIPLSFFLFPANLLNLSLEQKNFLLICLYLFRKLR